MCNNIINNNDENVRTDKKYIYDGIKKEQNRSALSLIFMMVCGMILSFAEFDISSLTQGIDGKYLPMIEEAVGGIRYCLYVGVPICFWLILGRGKIHIGFKKKMPDHTWASIGFCLGAMYFANVLASVLMSYASSVGIELPSPSAATEFAGVPHFILTVICGAVLPAFLEEIYLRGCIMGSIAVYDKTAALVTSSVLFGLMHLNPIQDLFATVAGFAIGYFVLRYESLWFGVTVHFLNNFIAIIKNTLYQGDGEHLVWCIVIDAAMFICGMLGAVYLIKKGELFSQKTNGNTVFAVSDILLIYIALAVAVAYMQISV